MSVTCVLYKRGLLRELSCLIPPLGDTVSRCSVWIKMHPHWTLNTASLILDLLVLKTMSNTFLLFIIISFKLFC